MRSAHLSCVLLLLLAASPVVAADLTKVDRSLAKEPAYRSQTPKYCLLVFGAEAKTRIWVVQDNDVLYVDRRGNGDLTSKGNHVACTKDPGYRKYQLVRKFEVGDITEADGKTSHTSLTVLEYENGYKVYVNLEGKYFRNTIGDDQGGLQFGASPQTAPVIHFGGPPTLRLLDPKTVLERGEKGSVLKTTLGTPGLGAGTFVPHSYETIPDNVHPRAEIEFPGAGAGGQPIRTKVALTDRC